MRAWEAEDVTVGRLGGRRPRASAGGLGQETGGRDLSMKRAMALPSVSPPGQGSSGEADVCHSIPLPLGDQATLLAEGGWSQFE